MFLSKLCFKHKAVTLLAGIAIMFTNTQLATATTDEIFTLQDVLVDITKTNPSILESIEYYQSVVAERSIATSEYYPVIGAEVTAGPERTKEDMVNETPEGEDPIPNTETDTSLTATTATLYARQNLYSGGKTKAFVAETDARIQAAAFEVLNVSNTVYLETAEAYINVVKAIELLKIAKQNAYTQEQIMRQVREKTEAGFNRVSELYNSESRLALSKGSYISRQQDLNQALATFHRQFGRLLNPEQFVKPEPQYVPPQELAETVNIAFANHPALKVAKYNIQTRRHTYEKSSSAYYPSVDLELLGEYQNDTGGDEGDVTQAGAYLSVSYTFFDGGYRKGLKVRDKQAIRKERQRSYVEQRNVNESVRLAWNIMEAELAKKDYLVEHVLLSAKTLEAFKEEYYVGRRTLLDLLNMENEFTDAKLSMTDSQYSQLVALYRLMQSTGVLLDEHDTGLRKIVNLPENKTEDLDQYDQVELNRDADQLADNKDQCDNTSPNAITQPFGCEDDYVNSTGYPSEEELQLKPYIIPQGSSAAPVTSSFLGGTNTAILPQKIVLEAKPNSDFITDEAARELEGYVEELDQFQDSKILVEGFIASDTQSEENIALSERRAELVKTLLVENGINEDQIIVKGRGNESPIASNSTPEGRKQNRRIEVSVLKQE